MAVFMFLSISGWFRELPGIYPFPLLYARINFLPFSRIPAYSTVTLFARFLGLSTSRPFATDT